MKKLLRAITVFFLALAWLLTNFPISPARAASDTTTDQVFGRTNVDDSRANGTGGMTPDTLHAPRGLATDSQGNIYILDGFFADTYYRYDYNRLLFFPNNSTTATDVWGQASLYRNRPPSNYNPVVTDTTFANPEGVAVDNAGNIYVSDSKFHRVLFFPKGSKKATKVYGQPDFTSSSPNGSLTKFNTPQGVAVDNSGGLYVADSGNGRVLYFPQNTITATKVYSMVYSSGIFSRLLSPSGVAIDPNGGIYVADSGGNRIAHYSANNPSTADRIYGQSVNNSVAASSGPDGLNTPTAVSADANGLYVADTFNNRVLHYSGTSTTADRVYGQPDFNSTASTKLTVGLNSLFNPTDVLSTTNGLYVADMYNNRVLFYPNTSITPTQVYGQNGDFTTNYSSLIGKPTASTLRQPSKAVEDSAGGTYIADTGNNRVLYYPPGSTTPTRVYGQNNFTTSNNEPFSPIGTIFGGGLKAVRPTRDTLFAPTAVAVSGTTDVYIADTGNNRVLHYSGSSTSADRVYGQNGSFTTRAYSNFGSIQADTLSSPTGLAIDASGGLYVADSGARRVLYFANDGNVTPDRVYGTNGIYTGPPAGQICLAYDSTAPAYSFCNPQGVALDAAGNLYVADFADNRVLVYPPGNTNASAVYGPSNFNTVTPSDFSGSINSSALYKFDLAIGNNGLYATNPYNAVVNFYTLGNNTPIRYYGKKPAYADPDFNPATTLPKTLQDTRFLNVSGVSVAPNGGIYISDAALNRVLYYPNANATVPTRVYGQNDNFYGGLANNPAGPTANTMYAPQSVALAANGDAFVADTFNHRVLFFTAANPLTPTRVYGQNGSFTTGMPNNGGLTADSLSLPSSVAVDSSNGLYVADTGNNRVLYFANDGDSRADRVYGQNGSFTAATPNNGGLTAATLNQPTSVTLDKNGGLYILDSGNKRILYFANPTNTTATNVYGQPDFVSTPQDFAPTAFTTDAGGGLYYSEGITNITVTYRSGLPSNSYTQTVYYPNSASYARLPRISGMAADKSGIYFATNILNGFAYFPNRQNTTLSSSLTNDYDETRFICDKQSSTATSLCLPAGVATSANGNFYVADSGNNRVLRFPPDPKNENFNWIDSKPVALRKTGNIYSEVITNQLVSGVTGSKWYKFNALAGSRVTIKLSGDTPDSVLPANFDLTLHKDIQKVYNQLVGSANATEATLRSAPSQYLPSQYLPSQYLPSQYLPSQYLPSQYLPSQYLPSQYLPSQYLPSQYLPSQYLPSQYLPSQYLPGVNFNEPTAPRALLSDLAPNYVVSSTYSTAVEKSLLALSVSQGVAPENIVVNTFDNFGDFYVQVRNFNSPVVTAPMRLEIQVETNFCDSVTAPPANLLVGSPQPGTTFKTVLLTDLAKITGTSLEQTTLLSTLDSLAARPEVAGVVVDLSDSRYERVAFARTQADTFPSCPYAKNILADEIKAVIDSYRPNNPGLRYVVLAGPDSAIPFYRYADKAGLAPESDFQLPFLLNGPADSARKSNLYLGQDYYGAGNRADYNYSGYVIPLPDLAVGRLVETASEITTMLNAYVATNGQIAPTSALVTGYDFVSDSAFAIKNELEAGMGTAADTLIQPVGLGPTDPSAWNGDALRAKLINGGRHDMLFLAGHFSPGGTEAADAKTGLSAFELLTSTLDLQNALFFSVGCHSGYNIPLADNTASPLMEEPDWAQVLARKGATSILGTGFQYGDTDLLEFSERLHLEFAKQLRTRPVAGNGRTVIGVGDALKRAKEVYLSQTEPVNGMHQKVLVETTLYGLPMLTVNLNGRDPVQNPSVAETPTQLAANIATNGLSYSDYTYPPTLTLRSKTLTNTQTNVATQATYYEGASGVSLNNLDPVLPLDIKNVTLGGAVLVGVGFRGGTYSDQTNYFPLTTAPTTEYGRSRATFGTPNFYPTRFWNINYAGTVADGTTNLTINPLQYRSAASDENSATGTVRKYNTLNFRLYYISAASPPSADSSPAITSTSAIVTNTQITFTVWANGGSSGVQEAWVTYYWEGDTNGAWQSLTLVGSGNGLYSGLLTIPNGKSYQNLRYIVQVVNNNGQVAISTNSGAYYNAQPLPGTPPPAVPPTTTLAVFQTLPSSVVYGSSPVIQGNLRRFDANAGGFVNFANETVRLEIGTQRVNVTTDANGNFAINNGSGSPNFYIRQFPAQNYPLKVSYGGSSYYQPAAVSASYFTVTKSPTNLNLVGNFSTNVQYSDDSGLAVMLKNSSGLALGLKPLTFVATKDGGSTVYTVTTQTDYRGLATLGTPPWEAGTYNITAYFNYGAGFEDFIYDSASLVLTKSLTLTLEDATIAQVQAGKIGQNFPQVSAKVVQTADGQPGNLQLATARFTVKSGNSVVTATDVPVQADGSVKTLLNGLAVGNYTLEVSLVSNYFSAAPVTSSLEVVAQNCAVVIENTDSGNVGVCGSLSGAIDFANRQSAGSGSITLDLSNVTSIAVSGALPALNNPNGVPITVLGACVAGSNVVLSPNNGYSGDGLVITGNNVTLKCIGLKNFSGYGIVVSGKNTVLDSVRVEKTGLARLKINGGNVIIRNNSRFIS